MKRTPYFIAIRKLDTRFKLSRLLALILMLALALGTCAQLGRPKKNPCISRDSKWLDPTSKTKLFDPLNLHNDYSEPLSKASERATYSDTKSKKAKKYVMYYTEAEVDMLGKLITEEAGGVKGTTKKSGVGWIVVNRVMSSLFPNTVAEVITQTNQFEGWDPNTVAYEECEKLARDILERWNREMNGEEDVGRTIPKDYLYFTGDGVDNYFCKVERGTPYVWGSKYISPYKS